MDLDIDGVDKAQLLAALHNNTRAVGMGMLHDLGRDMTVKESQAMLDARSGEPVAWFDYVHGRPVKVGFTKSTLLRADLYDRDAPGGEGACQRIVDTFRQF